MVNKYRVIIIYTYGNYEIGRIILKVVPFPFSLSKASSLSFSGEKWHLLPAE